MDSILEIRNLSFSFGQRPIFQGVNLSLMPLDAYALWGPGGVGKSTLLKIVAGLIPGAGGTIRIQGVEVSSASQKAWQNFRTRLGVVFQEGALISNMSIYDNIALPLRYHTRVGEGEVGKRVGDLMNILGIDRESDRALPAMVPSGVRKFAAIARALILEPSLLLFDDPAAGLEETANRRVVQALKEYQEKSQAALLFTTLDPTLAGTLANRLGVLGKNGILFEGAPRDILGKMAKEMSGS
jgi:phospholipid/cholesterol/gamma-HCH transport system ATP-binding protein